MRRVSNARILRWATLCGVMLACGGETADANSAAASSGGTPAAGGSTPAGGSSSSGSAATTGGYAGCANRSVVYDSGTTFPFENWGISYLPECLLTCGQSYGSIESIPAGLCASDPTCVVMMANGIPRYYLCSCVTGQWSCASVSGAP